MAAVVTLSLLGRPALAQEGAPPAACHSRCQEPSCLVESRRCLLEVGHASTARDLLKGDTTQHPAHVRLGLLLVRAHWSLGDWVSARQVLLKLAASHPADCQVRAWLIWLHIQQEALVQARDLLKAPGCPGTEAERARWDLLTSTLDGLQHDHEGAEVAMEKAHDRDLIFPEDRPVLRKLTASIQPNRPTPLTLRLDVGGGYTSNGMGGNPADPRANLSASVTQSPALILDLLTRFAPTLHRFVSPILELSLRGMFLTSREPTDMWDHSYLIMGARPGVSLGPARVYYHGQLFLLFGGDPPAKGPVQVGPNASGPRVFQESHRGEVELEPIRWVTLFAGGGYSAFREAIRSRAEVDGGIGVNGKLWRLLLLGGLSMRGHWAGESEMTVTHASGQPRRIRIQPYDLFGGSLLLSATLPLPYLVLRTRFIISFDTYSRSEGYFDAQDIFPDDDPEAGRQDVLVKGGLEVWSPAWHGLRAGASYEVAHRLSNKGAYEFTDHRALARVRFTFRLDPFAPSTAPATPGHEPLPHGVKEPEGLDDLRFQDLLRQEDAARRGSSFYH